MGTTERTALVTGATSGLGFEAAAQIAALDQGQVIVTGRSGQKARDARDELRQRIGRDVFETLTLVLDDNASVEAARRAQRAGWSAAVRLSGFDMPALSGQRNAGVEEVTLSKAA